MANRIQLDRRKDTVPWTWEPFAGVVVIYVFAILATAQVARAVAYLLAGYGWRWPTPQNQVTSAFAIFNGRAQAGLPGPHAPAVSPVLLYGCLGTLELVVLVGLTATTIVALLRFGPTRVLGMASRPGAQQLLGISRIHRHAAVIRPDLYGNRTQRRTSQQSEQGSGPVIEKAARRVAVLPRLLKLTEHAKER